MKSSRLTTDVLVAAYTQGLFPMGSDEHSSVDFYEPYVRCLFPLTGIHISRSLAKTLRSGRFRITFDQDFEGVMRGCLRAPGENWITEPLIRVYCDAHQEGWGHSCEVWSGDELVGGVYGLAIGSAFFAESMFHRKTDASKVALYSLIAQCQGFGFTLFDAQIMNPHLASLGAYSIPNGNYLVFLEESVKKRTAWGLTLDKNQDCG